MNRKLKKVIDDQDVKVSLKANAYTKSVFVHLKDNYRYIYSDNYFDLEKGEEKTILVTGDKVNPAEIEVTDFAKETR